MSDQPALSSTAILELFKHLVENEEAAVAREHFCEVVSDQMTNVGSWLGFDAWLGAGDIEDAGVPQDAEPDVTRRRSFIAVGLVTQISSELVSGALLLFRNGNQYGASALIRQLMECEYLLRAFRLNFGDAAKWLDANKEDRWEFTPKKLRKIGGFDRGEYANHCESGGHPHPRGGLLLDLTRKMHGLQLAVEGNANHVDFVRGLWLDFAFHCDRAWRAVADVLKAEHARFERVRSEPLAKVREAFIAWQEADVLARYAGQILAALFENPTQVLSDLLEFE